MVISGHSAPEHCRRKRPWRNAASIRHWLLDGRRWCRAVWDGNWEDGMRPVMGVSQVTLQGDNRMRFAVFCVLVAVGGTALAQEPAPEVLDIGSRRELFVDHYLIDTMDNVTLKMHQPIPAERVLWFDNPWEGRFCQPGVGTEVS